MILFNLLTLDAQRAQAAATLLLTERMAHDVFVDEAIANQRLTPAGTVASAPLCRLLFLTKASLYTRIEQLLHTHFPTNDFRLYATAVTHVEAAEADRVRGLA